MAISFRDRELAAAKSHAKKTAARAKTAEHRAWSLANIARDAETRAKDAAKRTGSPQKYEAYLFFEECWARELDLKDYYDQLNYMNEGQPFEPPTDPGARSWIAAQHYRPENHPSHPAYPEAVANAKKAEVCARTARANATQAEEYAQAERVRAIEAADQLKAIKQRRKVEHRRWREWRSSHLG